jgi:hypothetical protein
MFDIMMIIMVIRRNFSKSHLITVIRRNFSKLKLLSSKTMSIEIEKLQYLKEK